ncbi:MAG: entericidin A/B family lipoprotein [Collimonas sp.]
MMKKLVALGMLMASVYALSACNTFQGFGKDVEHVGEKIQGK